MEENTVKTNEIEEYEQPETEVEEVLEESSGRVPFADWYETVSGKPHGFQNRTVQGGIFMPLLLRRKEQGGKAVFYKSSKKC